MVRSLSLYFYIILFFFYIVNLFANNLSINGLDKLSLKDLQTQTSIDLNKDIFSDEDINTLLKDLYKSELIFDLKHNKVENNHNITIQENKLIENIFLNGNLRIDDDLLIKNISAKKKWIY